MRLQKEMDFVPIHMTRDQKPEPASCTRLGLAPEGHGLPQVPHASKKQTPQAPDFLAEPGTNISASPWVGLVWWFGDLNVRGYLPHLVSTGTGAFDFLPQEDMERWA